MWDVTLEFAWTTVVSKTKHSKTKTEARSTQNSQTKHRGFLCRALVTMPRVERSTLLLSESYFFRDINLEVKKMVHVYWVIVF